MRKLKRGDKVKFKTNTINGIPTTGPHKTYTVSSAQDAISDPPCQIIYLTETPHMFFNDQLTLIRKKPKPRPTPTPTQPAIGTSKRKLDLS